MTRNKFTTKELHEIDHFNTLASNYDSNYGYNSQFTKYKILKKVTELEKFINNKFNKKSLTIVEMGCGTGEYTLHIAKAFPKSKVIGLDISDGILDIARMKCRKYKNVKFVNKSAYKTGYNNESVDVVCGFYFLHHVDLKTVAKETERILKPAGVAFFYEPNILNPVVYMIKSNKVLKNLVGDSPDEWAINPLILKQQFKYMNVDSDTSEFILPLSILPYSWNVAMDKLTSFLSKFPLLKYMGGSVAIRLQKNVS